MANILVSHYKTTSTKAKTYKINSRINVFSKKYNPLFSQANYDYINKQIK